MTPAQAAEAYAAADRAWAAMVDTAASRAATYELWRHDEAADPLRVEEARIAWAIAHTSAAHLWVERAAARDRSARLDAAAEDAAAPHVRLAP